MWTVLSCLLSPSSPETWWIAEKARYEGLASQLCYGALFFCFFLSPVRLRPVLYSAAAGVAVFFAVVLLQRAGGNPLGLYPPGTGFALNPEFQGTIGNVDMDTGYLCLLAGLFLYALAGPLLSGRKSDCSGMSIRLLKGKKALPSAVLLPALLLTLFLIVTMGVQFGVVSLAALVFLTLLRILPKNLRLPALILLLAAVLLIVWFWPGTSGGVWELHEIIHGRSRLSFGSNRIAVWTWSLGLFRESPLLGGGSGTFPERFNRYLAEHGLSVPTEQDGTELPDYFDRKLGTELIAFVARDEERIVSVAYLHIIEMPANSILLNGMYDEVLSVYTEPEYRGKGLCTRLMQNLVEYGRKIGLGRIDLSATDAGYPVYAKIGFKEKEHRYRDMRYKY